MKLKRAVYKHFMGFEDYEFSPGKITKISGPNASGKTSLIEGLKNIVEGGHNAQLIRDDAEEAIVGVEFSPQGSIFKRILPSRYELDIEKDDPLDDTTPMEYVRSIFSDLAVNPVQFITDPKNREDWLAKSLPIETSLEELQDAVGDISTVDDKYGNMPALDAIDRLYKLLYKSRREYNRTYDEKKKSVETLKKDIPDEIIDEDIVQEEIDSLREEYNRLEKEGVDRINNINEAAQKEIDKIKDRAEKARKKIREEYHPKGQEINAKVSELHTTLKHAASANASIKMWKKMENEVIEMREQRHLYDAALTGLKKLKASKLEEIPIEGIEIRDGELYRNDDGTVKHFDKLNLAKQIDTVMRIALLHADKQGSKIKMILLDNAEHLDEDTQAEIVKWVQDLDRDDVHVIMTQVQSRDKYGNKLEGLQVETL